MYVTDLSEVTESLASHVKTKCMMSSSTLLNGSSPLTEYAAKISSDRATADQRRINSRGATDWRQEVTISFGDYGKARLTPQSMSYLETRAQIPTITNQWISSWLVGRRKRKISTVSTATSNG